MTITRIGHTESAQFGYKQLYARTALHHALRRLGASATAVWHGASTGGRGHQEAGYNTGRDPLLHRISSLVVDGMLTVS